jgi:hypothetical protein
VTRKIEQLDALSERAAQMSIEEAIRRYYRVTDCIADIETNSACILFNPYRHKRWIDAFGKEEDFDTALDVALTVPLTALSKKVIALAQPLLNRMLDQNDALTSYEKWKTRERRVLEGMVTGINETALTISFKGGVGTCEKREWIAKENYTLGETHYFKVKRVTLKEGGIHITLSRRSKRIPEYVLESLFPRYEFTCYRRIPGIRSWIKTTASKRKWGLFTTKEIRRHMAFEHLQFEN